MSSIPNRSITTIDEDTTNSATLSSSIDFGTPDALDYVRQLTDVEAMTRLLHECIAYQRALDLDLDNLLSQRSDLDKQLVQLQ